MIPVDQDIHGERGNCWAACIASILDRPLKDLETFHDLYTAYHLAIRTGETVPWEIRSAYPLELARVTGRAVIRFATAIERGAPTGYSIANGPGSRGHDHSCVAFDGFIFHDPHESRAGLIEIVDYDVLIPIVWPNDHLYSDKPNRPPTPTLGGSIHAP